MNAPMTIKSARSDRTAGMSQDSPVSQGIARHVCVDGCQFVVTGKVPDVGQRLSFAIGPEVVICGSVSWVLGERIGFGFDRQIGPGTMSVLSAHFGALTLVPLSPDMDGMAAQD